MPELTRICGTDKSGDPGRGRREENGQSHEERKRQTQVNPPPGRQRDELDDSNRDGPPNQVRPELVQVGEDEERPAHERRDDHSQLESEQASF